MKILITFAASVLLSGCATNSRYAILYDSEPRNAAVTCNGQMVGYTPVYQYVDASEIKPGERRRLPDCRATWVSGATERFGNVLDVTRHPNGTLFTVRRSPSEAGYTQDAQAAMYGAQQNNQSNTNYDRGPTYTTCNKVFGQILCNSY